MIRIAILLSSLATSFNEQVEADFVQIHSLSERINTKYQFYKGDDADISALDDVDWGEIILFGRVAEAEPLDNALAEPDIDDEDEATILFKSTANNSPIEYTTVDPVLLVTRYQMECVEETRVDSDVIVKIKHRNWWIPTAQTPLVKDWALCVLMKSGVMTKQGVYKIDVALQRVPLSVREITEKQIDSCLSTKAIPAPDIAFQYIKCFQKLKSNQSAVVSAF